MTIAVVRVQVPPEVQILHQGVKHNAEVAQLVEHNLAKVRVASSSLVFRSKSPKVLKTNKLRKQFVGFCVKIATETQQITFF